MTMRKWLILTVVTIAACCNAQTGSVNSGSTHTITITEDQNGQTVQVQKSDDVVVTFVAASGTGYQWTMEPSDFATAKEEDVPQQPGLPGGPVKIMFHVQVKQAVTLKFDFARAWEKDKPPAKTFSVTLNLSE
jgi:predicted secreted protein